MSQTIDGESVVFEAKLDARGAAKSVQMERYGNEGRKDWGTTPYGFTVEAEKAFGDYTIPTKFRGGWWFGTSRFVEGDASDYEIVDARYG